MKDCKIPVKIKPWISMQRVVFFILFCLTCSLWGQEGKKTLEEKDYAQWKTLLPNKLSFNGKWVCYGLAPSNKGYKIMVQNTETNKSYAIDNCYDNNFSSKGGWFCALDFSSTLTKIDLQNNKKEAIPNIQSYKFSPTSENLAYFQSIGEGSKKALYIEDLKKEKISKFDDVLAYDYSPNGNFIAMLQTKKKGQKVLIYDIEKRSIQSEHYVTSFTTQLLWQPDSKGLTYWEENGKSNEMYWWTDISDSTKIKKFNSNLNEVSVSNIYRMPFLFSDDGNRLFFQVEKLEPTLNITDSLTNNNVEIWNAKDEFVYPAAQNILNYWPKLTFTIAWDKIGEGWEFLGRDNASVGIFGQNGQFAYSYNFKENSMAAWDRDVSYPIMGYNIDEGTHKSILENNYALNFVMSPSGRYLSYFKDGNWFIYDAKNDSHTNLTSGLNTSFTDSLSKDLPNSAFEEAIWIENEKEVALYDGLDIWLITVDGKTSKRITNGKETNRKFRFHLTTDDFVLRTKFGLLHSGNTVNLDRGAILSARDIDKGKTGYFMYTGKDGVQPIVYGDALYSNLRLSKDRKTVVYSMETYNQPPKLIFKNLNKGFERTVYQSNPQHFDYQWGKEELVEYKTSDGNSLKGILYYPSNFDSLKKYPTVVFIYELQSNNYHKYYNPTLNDRIGFSISDYTSQGYFVFLPDIKYEIGDPGRSALKCVMAGVDNICQRPYIDQKKLGLYGHSFGGYESMFILTQTNRFATVVAGAGASNLLSFYLSMAWIWDRPQYTRFERHQWRMGDTFFNIPEAYNRNSPILYSPNVSTPFLSWAGKEDSNVNWEQDLEFFLALRKLEKEHIMLLYEGEGHDVTKPINQKDLTHKMLDWFNFYLKDAPSKAWMTKMN